MSLFGFGKTKEQNNPAPTSGFPHSAMMHEAGMWAMKAPLTRSYASVAATGSMLPVFGSNAVLLLEKVISSQLRPGDIALYEKLDKSGTICHRVREVNKRGAVLFTGDNNDNTRPDGWIVGDRIRWRVAGILYAS